MKRPLNAPASNCVPERRRDPVTGLWHVLAATRAARPSDFVDSSHRDSATIDLPRTGSDEIRSAAATEGPSPPAPSSSKRCAFCRGFESETTPTIATFRCDDTGGIQVATEADWQVRVVENLYPAFVAADPEDRLASSGRHEVIIESPQHQQEMTDLRISEVEVVCYAYRDRFRGAAEDPAWRHAVLFKNHGRFAGMSREHIHSQFVALSELAPLIQLELNGSQAYFRECGRCVFCDLVDRAVITKERVVVETPNLVAFCPEASRTGYEVWVVPKSHQAAFQDADDAVLRELAEVLFRLFVCLDTAMPGLAFNLLVHSSPFDMDVSDHYHWHIEIIPRMSFVAGLEWATGVMINTVPPEVAAGRLRSVVKI